MTRQALPHFQKFKIIETPGLRKFGDKRVFGRLRFQEDHLAMRNRGVFAGGGKKPQQLSSDNVKRGKREMSGWLIFGFYCLYKIRCQEM